MGALPVSLLSKITVKVMAAHVMSGGKYFCLSLKSSSCSQLVSKCEDVLSAHATLSTRSHARTHTHTHWRRVMTFEQHITSSLNQPWKPFFEVMDGFRVTFRDFTSISG